MTIRFRLRKSLTKVIEKARRKRLRLEFDGPLRLDPSLGVALLAVQRDRPLFPTGRVVGIDLETLGEALVSAHKMVRAVELLFLGQARRQFRMNRTEIRQQGGPLRRLIDELAGADQLLDGG